MPTANQAAMFATPSPLSWNEASDANPWGASNGYLPDTPLFLQSGMAPTPPSFGKQPFAPLMSAHEVAALKTKNGVIVEGGRPDGPFTAFMNGLVDPFGMTSGLVGLALPEAGAAMSAQYANHPVAHAVGSALSPMIPGLGVMNAAIRYAPRTIATLLGLNAGMPVSEAGRDADRVDPLLGEINALEAQIAKKQAAAPQPDDQGSKPESDTPYMPPGFDQRPSVPQTRAEAASSPDIEDDQARLAALQEQAREVAQAQAAAKLPRGGGLTIDYLEEYAPAIAAGAGLATGKYRLASRKQSVGAWNKTIRETKKEFNEGGRRSAEARRLKEQLAGQQADGALGGNFPIASAAGWGGAAGAATSMAPDVARQLYDGTILDAGADPEWWKGLAQKGLAGGIFGAGGAMYGMRTGGNLQLPNRETDRLLGAARRAAPIPAAGAPIGPGQAGAGVAVLPAIGYSQPYRDQNGDWRFPEPPTLWPWR
jgi:hypothetical protein